jgi:hypothetical protein
MLKTKGIDTLKDLLHAKLQAKHNNYTIINKILLILLECYETVDKTYI